MTDDLTFHTHPEMTRPRLLIGLSGWMDGGEVSTASLRYIAAHLDAEPLADIDPGPFYLYSFPGTMQFSELFRPHVKIEDGLMMQLEHPPCRFFWCPGENLILLIAKEPNVHWRRFADCIFEVVRRFDVELCYFIGSVGGGAPHTREPRLYASVSAAWMRERLASFGVRMSNYEGPGSFVTYLTHRASLEALPMASLVAEIPAYVQGANPQCIESALRRVCGLLNLRIDMDDLHRMSERFQRRLGKVVREHPELQEMIEKFENDYDNEVFDTQMGDLKDWLEAKGIRLE